MATIHKQISDFAAKSGGMFPNIDRTDVAHGLHERLASPEVIDQGDASLCGPAALMFALLRKSPQTYVDYVTRLYDDGEAALGNAPGIWVEPGEDCRRCDPAGAVPPVDWVALASLRDSDNDFSDYESPGNQTAGITPPATLSRWLKKCGFTDLVNETSWVFTAGEESLARAGQLHKKGRTVCLFCKGVTLEEIMGTWDSVASHWAVMTRAPKFTGSSVELQLFSWGTLYDLNVGLDTFLSTYFGFVAARP